MSETPWVPGQADTQEASDFEPIASQDEFDKRVSARLARERAKFADYDQLKSKVEEIESASKSEVQKALDKVNQLQSELESERFNAIRSQIASTKGVPAHRISGATQEELESSADAYLAEVADLTKARAPKKTGLSSGATGTDNRLDPKDKAAAMLQQMFRSGG